jgi:hypothetical protein
LKFNKTGGSSYADRRVHAVITPMQICLGRHNDFSENVELHTNVTSELKIIFLIKTLSNYTLMCYVSKYAIAKI